ncbi:MAG: nuclear transport factor 2 family protein [Pseudomonadales bacterium]|nr:nuclear transport factor 2 family protein [Pseudomonadales bacterium]
MNLDEKKKIIQEYIDAYNRFDIDNMLSLLSDDVVFENIQNNEINASSKGKVEFRELAESAKTIFSERKQTIVNITDSIEKTSVEISYYGRLACDLPNGMKLGDEWNLNGISEFVFSNGKIILLRDLS